MTTVASRGRSRPKPARRASGIAAQTREGSHHEDRARRPAAAARLRICRDRHSPCVDQSATFRRIADRTIARKPGDFRKMAGRHDSLACQEGRQRHDDRAMLAGGGGLPRIFATAPRPLADGTCRRHGADHRDADRIPPSSRPSARVASDAVCCHRAVVKIGPYCGFDTKGLVHG